MIFYIRPIFSWSNNKLFLSVKLRRKCSMQRYDPWYSSLSDRAMHKRCRYWTIGIVMFNFMLITKATLLMRLVITSMKIKGGRYTWCKLLYLSCIKSSRYINMTRNSVIFEIWCNLLHNEQRISTKGSESHFFSTLAYCIWDILQ